MVKKMGEVIYWEKRYPKRYLNLRRGHGNAIHGSYRKSAFRDCKTTIFYLGARRPQTPPPKCNSQEGIIKKRKRNEKSLSDTPYPKMINGPPAIGIIATRGRQ